MKTLLLFTSAVFLMACSGDQAVELTPSGNDPETSQKTITTQYEMVKATSKDAETHYIANMAIGGMSCEKMCVGSIKAKLAGMDGVLTTDFPEFDGAQTTNKAVIEFDPAKVTEKEMVTAISSLYDGVYQVHTVSVEEQTPSDAPSGNGNNTKEEPTGGSTTESAV